MDYYRLFTNFDVLIMEVVFEQARYHNEEDVELAKKIINHIEKKINQIKL